MIRLCGCACLSTALWPSPAAAAPAAYCADNTAIDDVVRRPLISYHNAAHAHALYTRLQILSYVLKVNPPLYIGESYSGAYASINDGYVVIGDRLLQANEQLKYGLRRSLGVLAHECAHVFQVTTGIDRSLYDRLDRHPIKFVELHADYMAGAMMHFLEEGGTKSPDAIASVFYELGDDGRTEEHHGTWKDRYGAYRMGYAEFDISQHADGTDPMRIAADGIHYLLRTYRG